MKKQKTLRFLLVTLPLLLCFFCTACGGGSGTVNNNNNNVNGGVSNSTNNNYNANNNVNNNNNANNNVNNNNNANNNVNNNNNNANNNANNNTNNGGSYTDNNPNGGTGGGTYYERDENFVNEIGMYEGLWISEVTDQYDYLQIDAEGNLQLYSDGYVLDEGYLWYDPEWSTTYIDSTLDGFLEGACIEMEGGQIYIDVCGYFDYLDGRGGQWQGAAGGTGGAYIDNGNNGNYGGNDNNGGNDTFYSWDSELCQRNVSEFEGTWYYDGDYSAMSYIVIDRNGNWSYYERAVGDAEATRMDYGTFSYSAYEVSTYYAESAQYAGLSIRVFEFDEGIILWGDNDMYYRMF